MCIKRSIVESSSRNLHPSHFAKNCDFWSSTVKPFFEIDTSHTCRSPNSAVNIAKITYFGNLYDIVCWHIFYFPLPFFLLLSPFFRRVYACQRTDYYQSQSVKLNVVFRCVLMYLFCLLYADHTVAKRGANNTDATLLKLPIHKVTWDVAYGL